VLSTVGFLGQIVTFVGAGEVRSGGGTQPHPGDDEGSVAHVGWHQAAGAQDGGDASVPTHRPRHPRPYETKPLLCLFHNISTFERGESGAL